MPTITFTVNGESRDVETASGVPLLYVLRNDLGLGSPQFGCGLSQCGACSVLVNGKEVRACVVPVKSVAGKNVTTLEGLPGRWARRAGQPASGPHTSLHPVQQAWIDKQVPMCGFCQNGMIMKAIELLERVPEPNVAQIKEAFSSGPSPHLCRCGTYLAIIEAVQHAAKLMARPAE